MPETFPIATVTVPPGESRVVVAVDRNVYPVLTAGEVASLVSKGEIEALAISADTDIPREFDIYVV